MASSVYKRQRDSFLTRSPLYLHRLFALIPGWISNHTPSKVWDVITYSFPKFNCFVEVLEWIITFYCGCNYLSMLGLRVMHVSKGGYFWWILSHWHPGTIKYPDSKVNGVNMGSIWGREDPGGPHVGPMNLAIWVVDVTTYPLQSFYPTSLISVSKILSWYQSMSEWVIKFNSLLGQQPTRSI